MDSADSNNITLMSSLEGALATEISDLRIRVIVTFAWPKVTKSHWDVRQTGNHLAGIGLRPIYARLNARDSGRIKQIFASRLNGYFFRLSRNPKPDNFKLSSLEGALATEISDLRISKKHRRPLTRGFHPLRGDIVFLLSCQKKCLGTISKA